MTIDVYAYRHEHGLSQARLAALLGVTVGTVSRWERGETAPPAYVTLALAGLAAELEAGQ